ncbi:putative metallophosphoesterase [Micromonospora sp. MW-13]|uniref:metallophosphoesterase n=1 Tax=unclassified Micromonospora TaxID=2617518 RepID=UPI000EC816D8|nr:MULTISPECIES: metallophosphoesterase [unclassified Micromonospora]MCX4469253.1 metallophosphoesterase [Micromonospora sp. NBC_01655]RGC68696.1 putative metallophosphoesterase [Micromonospora sp. MW-13]
MLATLTFVGFAALVVGLLHFYLWKRLVKDTTGPGRWRRTGAVAALVLALLVPATMIGTRAGLFWLAWPGYLWLAVMFYLLVALLVLEVPMLVARLVLRRRVVAAEPTAAAPEPVLVGASGGADPPAAAAVDQPDHDPARRLLLARGAAIFAGLTATGVTGYGVRNAMGPPRLDRVRIPLAKLPRGMDGLRIATVSDIHLGPLRGRAHTERIVAMINRLDADLVAVVGDLVDGSVAELGEAAAPLRGLRSRYGSFFVTGNHEYYSGVEEWVPEVDRLGLRVLQNTRQEIRTPGGVLDLAGVNDVSAAGTGLAAPADYAAALGDRDPGRPVVLLAHQPVAAVEAAKFGVDLQLSGHTHGGQIVPFNLLVNLEQPVVSGLGEVDGTKVYVTNGAGFWGPPVRVGADPQITLVELRTP